MSLTQQRVRARQSPDCSRRMAPTWPSVVLTSATTLAPFCFGHQHSTAQHSTVLLPTAFNESTGLPYISNTARLHTPLTPRYTWNACTHTYPYQRQHHAIHPHKPHKAYSQHFAWSDCARGYGCKDPSTHHGAEGGFRSYTVHATIGVCRTDVKPILGLVQRVCS